ncbi:hypothetical protein BD410DRAFT_902307 [Rickenella mellea]|uniref:Fungal-type protein kinase domain-containing protein n=1 Tax=Rickenella mellea TaxID=50990 RepID=A0A4Y7PKG0_9AGAM|nr:hypothetical protein BD410DRAFT_902307 [Rickenella mellea]
MPFRYNPLHDLESAWWIFFWTSLNSNFVKKDLDVLFEYNFARKRLGYSRARTMDFIPMDRSEKMTNPAVVILHAFEMLLLFLYQEIESKTEVDEWDFAQSHHEMIKAFDDANVEQGSAQATDIQLPPEDDTQAEKRERGDGDDATAAPCRPRAVAE